MCIRDRHKTLYGPFGVGGFISEGDISLKPFLVGGTGSDSCLLYTSQIKNGMSISRRRQEIIYEKQWVSLVQWICLFHSVEAKILQ